MAKQKKGPSAIKAYFDTPGYPPLSNSELLDLKKNDPAGYEEVKVLCEEALSRTAS